MNQSSEKIFDLALATFRELPNGTTKVLGTIGNGLIASEKAAGQDIAAAWGASAYQRQIVQTRAREQASFSQLVKQRDAARAAGRDTTKLDAEIKNLKYTPDDTSSVFPALKKTNGQIAADFAGLALDTTSGGLGGAAKGARVTANTAVGTASEIGVKAAATDSARVARAVENGTVASKDVATAALPAARQIAYAWEGLNTYREGGKMTAIEHIIYRHSFGSGFSNVSRFAKDTRAKDIQSFVDQAARYGSVTSQGGGTYKIVYNVGRTIGTGRTGETATGIEVFIRNGVVQTAYPIATK
ncbi:hypothetical protein JJE66_34245 [Bradyrhizobium diazoefficiens]|uniref:hypothetical protein n=1 Tax=Bradyrhizobium diazoefficiens TaxID=1355477 RepID=UPI00190B00B6|nr:hypothetical protein [Bradyrhizobium diazoefficiens]MBK3666266.1 hypothetical protein [Bradyrhizobium diazoefficiens]